jgi:hypothetical protein
MVILQWERAAVTRGGYMASRASLFAALHESEIGPESDIARARLFDLDQALFWSGARFYILGTNTCWAYQSRTY